MKLTLHFDIKFCSYTCDKEAEENQVKATQEFETICERMLNYYKKGSFEFKDVTTRMERAAIGIAYKYNVYYIKDGLRIDFNGKRYK